jgi:hypothetical protein
MFVFVSVNESHGTLWHLVHDLIYIKINKMAAFFPISLVHIVGLRGILFSLFTKPSDGEHKEQPVQRPAQQQQQQQQQCSPGATTHHPNLADASHAADPQQHAAQPAASTPHLHYHTSLVWQSSYELAPPPSHKPKTPWTQKIGSRGSRRNS